MHSGPVFADPTGRRRRLVRRLGVIAAAVLAACLAAVVVAMAGGPQAPFTRWAAPRPALTRSGSDHDQPSARRTATPSPGTQPRAAASVRASSSASAGSANRAGHTPPGATKSPNPHKSSHGA